jgi:hypothetical protein
MDARLTLERFRDQVAAAQVAAVFVARFLEQQEQSAAARIARQATHDSGVLRSTGSADYSVVTCCEETGNDPTAAAEVHRSALRGTGRARGRARHAVNLVGCADCRDYYERHLRWPLSIPRRRWTAASVLARGPR